MEKKKELVFVPAPAAGHLVSMLELANRLLDREDNLSITVLIIKEPLASNISSYIESLSTPITSRIRFIHIPPINPPSLENCALETFVSLLFESYKPHIKHTIITKLMSSDSDSVRLAGLVIDFFFTTLIDVGNELGVPTYLFFTSGAGNLGLTLHFPTLHTQITSELIDSVTELKIPSFVNLVPSTVLPSPLLNKMDDAYNWLLYHSRRCRETKGIIVNTFVDLEPNALNSFKNGRNPPVYAVGPLIDLQGKTHLRSDRTHHGKIMRWLDDQPQSSVVLLCFGSIGYFGAPQVKEIAHGIEKSGHRFLWSLRQPAKKGGLAPPIDATNLEEILPDGFLNRTVERGLVCGWIPQVKVLAHKAIGGFVSHCGWNSILESVWFGIPMLTWPLYAEQQLNAFVMVRELGLAVELKLDYKMHNVDDVVMADEIERGVGCLMDSDNNVRKKVIEMGKNSRNAVMDGGSSFESLGHFIEVVIDGVTVGPN